MGNKEKRKLLSYLRQVGKFKGYEHRSHRTKKKKTINEKKIKINKLREKELMDDYHLSRNRF